MVNTRKHNKKSEMKELQLLQMVLEEKGYNVELTTDLYNDNTARLDIRIKKAIISVFPDNGWRCELNYCQEVTCMADGLLLDPLEIVSFCETVKRLNEFIG